MDLIYTVNDWKLYKDGEVFALFNSAHTEWGNYFNIARGTWRYSYKRVPKTIQKVIDRELGYTTVTLNSITNSQRTFGIEIECFHNSNSDIRYEVERELNSQGISCQVMGYTHEVTTGWHITSDSSIRGNYCMEVVSPVLHGEEGIEEVKKVMKTLSRLGCRVNKSTGMHVHVGANDLNTTQLHKVFRFYKVNEVLFDSLVSLSRRDNNNHYCKSFRGVDVDSRFPNDRYFKVNYQSYCKYGTIEFRQHQGSLNGEKAEHWIKLVRALVDYCKLNNSVSTPSYTSIETLVNSLGLSSEANWYLERAEELSA